MNNNNIVFIFGIPNNTNNNTNTNNSNKNNIHPIPNIPRLLKIACYVPIDQVINKFRPRVIRYLMDENWVLRCWGCHQILVDYAYPYYWISNRHCSKAVIVLSCSHSCSAFIKYFKITNVCPACDKFFITPVNELTYITGFIGCPTCWFNDWTSNLTSRLSLIFNISHNHIISNQVAKFAILNKCMAINK